MGGLPVSRVRYLDLWPRSLEECTEPNCDDPECPEDGDTPMPMVVGMDGREYVTAYHYEHVMLLSEYVEEPEGEPFAEHAHHAGDVSAATAGKFSQPLVEGTPEAWFNARYLRPVLAAGLTVSRMQQLAGTKFPVYALLDGDKRVGYLMPRDPTLPDPVDGDPVEWARVSDVLT